MILFDIDGTLLRCGKQVASIFLDALEEVFGSYRVPEDFSFAGKTDTRIVSEIVAHLELDEADLRARVPRMRARYVELLETRLDRERMRLLPGVVEILERSSARSDVHLGLLTGNWQEGAWVKLSRFALGGYFAFGAFGEDGHARRELVPVALERARRHCGRHFSNDQVLIVGDTELDVDCARAAGVPCLAVATGHTSAEALRAAGATWVVSDLLAAGDLLP